MAGMTYLVQFSCFMIGLLVYTFIQPHVVSMFDAAFSFIFAINLPFYNTLNQFQLITI